MSDEKKGSPTLRIPLPPATPLTEADAHLVDGIKRNERFEVAVKAFEAVVKPHMVQGRIDPQDAHFGLDTQFKERIHALADKGQLTVHQASVQAFREIAKSTQLSAGSEQKFEHAYHDGIAHQHLPELPHKPYSKAPQR